MLLPHVLLLCALLLCTLLPCVLLLLLLLHTLLLFTGNAHGVSLVVTYRCTRCSAADVLDCVLCDGAPVHAVFCWCVRLCAAWFHAVLCGSVLVHAAFCCCA